MGSMAAGLDFAATRFGVIMSSQTGQPHEAWGVLNPGGVRSPDGEMHLFPRLIAEGNYSRIGHARVRFDGEIPSATDLRADGALDVYYGAADHVIAAARVSLPSKIPIVVGNSNGG